MFGGGTKFEDCENAHTHANVFEGARPNCCGIEVGQQLVGAFHMSRAVDRNPNWSRGHHWSSVTLPNGYTPYADLENDVRAGDGWKHSIAAGHPNPDISGTFAGPWSSFSNYANKVVAETFEGARFKPFGTMKEAELDVGYINTNAEQAMQGGGIPGLANGTLVATGPTSASTADGLGARWRDRHDHILVQTPWGQRSTGIGLKGTPFDDPMSFGTIALVTAAAGLALQAAA